MASPRVVACGIGLTAVAGLAGHAVVRIVDALANGGNATAAFSLADARARTNIGAEPALKVLADDWNETIRSESFWRGRPASPGQGPKSTGRPSRLQGPPPAPGPSFWWSEPQNIQMPFLQPLPRVAPRQVSGYRTVCVRTCDGFFFPISYGTSESSFSRDQATCSTSCPGARLYYYRARGEDPDDMVDLSGQPYTKMKNANLFRTQYVDSCKCKPDPWEQANVDRHRIYALEEQRRKGNQAVVAELDQLKGKKRNEARANLKGKGRRKTHPEAEVVAAVVAPPATVAGPTVNTVAASAGLGPPRSDASRGQGGDRHVVASLTTGSIATASAPTATSGAEAPASSPPRPPVAVETVQAPVPSVQPPPITAALPGQPGHDASSDPADDAFPSNDRRARGSHLASTRHSIMRLGGAGPQRSPEPRRAEIPRIPSRTAEWVSKAFNP